MNRALGLAADIGELKYRAMQPQDIAPCARLLQEQFPNERQDRTLVQRVWPRWLSEGSLKSVAVLNGEKRVVAFGASVFVTDAFFEKANADPTPYVASWLNRTAFTEESPVCTPASVANLNATCGLNICILHSGPPDFSAGEDVARLKSEMTQGFLDLHRGYQIKNIVVEAFGDRELSFYISGGGFRVLSDYRSWYLEQVARFHVVNDRPYLLSLAKADVLRRQMDPLLPLFLYTHPRGFLSLGEQAMLIEALKGHTDEELAVNLFLSLSAVKKRWLNVFAKVEHLVPDILCGAPNRPPHKRGVQRRHQILRYMRNHPEELRPYASKQGLRT